MSMKNSNDTIGNRTRDLPACCAVPQPTAPPRTTLLFNFAFEYDIRRSQVDLKLNGTHRLLVYANVYANVYGNAYSRILGGSV